mmetsp:Transcript_9352/g.29172  ORF Transcript_9352/g.29172 Transcript_9352/m.29172 type:complete len:221 (-) Transcript_9352:33-695(-)
MVAVVVAGGDQIARAVLGRRLVTASVSSSCCSSSSSSSRGGASCRRRLCRERGAALVVIGRVHVVHQRWQHRHVASQLPALLPLTRRSRAQRQRRLRRWARQAARPCGGGGATPLGRRPQRGRGLAIEGGIAPRARVTRRGRHARPRGGGWLPLPHGRRRRVKAQLASRARPLAPVCWPPRETTSAQRGPLTACVPAWRAAAGHPGALSWRRASARAKLQ